MTQGAYLDQYRKTAVQTASPLQLVIMLYDGALKFLDKGKCAMREGNRFEQNQNLQKAQRIVTELTACLDMAKGGEVAKNLFSLYTFIGDQLIEANLTDSEDGIEHSIRVLSELRSSWVELENQQRRGSAEDLPLAS